MGLSASNETSPQRETLISRCEPRCVLRGKISDAVGNGELVFSRQRQTGFYEAVDYDTHGYGIEAVSKFADAKNPNAKNDCQGSTDRLLECRYSVIAKAGCSVDHLKIFVSVSDASLSPRMSITLTWRGGNLAKLVDPDNQVASRDDGSLVRQDETIVLECGSAHCSTWYIEVPSHSVSLAIQIDESQENEAGGRLAIIADTVFWIKTGFRKLLQRENFSQAPEEFNQKKYWSLLNRLKKPLSRPSQTIWKNRTIQVKTN